MSDLSLRIQRQATPDLLLRVQSMPEIERVCVVLNAALVLLTDAEAKHLVKAIEMGRMYLTAGESCIVDLVPSPEQPE